MRRLSIVVRSLLGRRRFEDSMTEELRFHLDTYVEELVGAGLSRAEAERRARLEFGRLDNVKDDCREARGLRLMDELRQDVRYGLRVLGKSRSFTATALATLALCLGANLSVFAVVDAILLRPLPFPASDRLVRIYNTYPKAGVPDDGASVANYYERRGALSSFSGISLDREGTALVGEVGATERAAVMRVTTDFFSTLGAAIQHGRPFTETEMESGASPVVILSDGFWRERFNSEPSAVGRTVRVDGRSHSIIGVLPPSFRFLSSEARLYLPLASDPASRGPLQRHSGSSTQMLARLAEGASVKTAQAEVDAHNTAMEVGSPTATMMAAAGFRSLVVPLHGEHVVAVRPTLLFVQAGAVCLLLVGSVNLINLLLLRVTARARELAIRQAIGGSRGRIVRQLIVETMLLTVGGAALGLVVAAFGIRVLATMGIALLPLGAQVAFDARVAGVAAIAALVIGMAMATAAAWFSLRSPAGAALALESRAATGGRAIQRLRHTFVVSQIALAFVLLFATGLLAESLRRIAATSPGFRPANVLTAQISLPLRGYRDTAARRTFVDRLMNRLQEQPGIGASGVVTDVPFSGHTIKSAVTVDGYTPLAAESVRGHYARGVGGRYFDAMGFTLIEGRLLDPSEIRTGRRVVVVDDDFARRYWPGASALGHRLFPGPQAGPVDEAYAIVGVVGAARHTGLTDREATGTVFYPDSSVFDSDLFLVVRTMLPPERVAGSVREAVHAIDPDLAVSDVRSMEARLADTLVVRRTPPLLAAAFSVLALLLTAVGTYGVIASAVVARRREIALRIALGATPSRIGGAFLALAVRLVIAGSVVGLAGAWIAGRAMETLLVDVSATHVPTLVATALVIGVVSSAACVVPAMRATRVSPAQVLSDS